MRCNVAPRRCVSLNVTARRLLLGLLVATMPLAGCESSGIRPPVEAADPPPPAAKLLGGGSWNIEGFESRTGEPFEVTLVTTSVEAINNTQQDVSPVCVLTYGSQVAVIETHPQILSPGDPAWVTGTSEFPRPLDDYESSAATCYTRLPDSVSRAIERERRLLTVGRTTQVPNLIGEPVDARLGNFSRGLDISIAKERTRCTERHLMKLSRSVDAFGKPPCGDPVVVDQDPAPGSSAVVGDEISLVVGRRLRSEQRESK